MYIYFIVVNIVGFTLMAADKKRAKTHRARIAENVLMFIALIGGCAGALLGMFLLKHKTKKLKFCIGLPLITAAYALALSLIYR